MDDADRAEHILSNAISDGIAKIRRSSNLVPSGFCHYCAESVGSSVLFCCPDCRDDYEAEQKMKRIMGKR